MAFKYVGVSCFCILVENDIYFLKNSSLVLINLLKIGRHFRLDEETKFVVGRHKDENEMIKALALPGDILLEAKDYVGPVSILRGKNANYM